MLFSLADQYCGAVAHEQPVDDDLRATVSVARKSSSLGVRFRVRVKISFRVRIGFRVRFRLGLG